MKQFIFMMHRHALPMLAAAASSSVLTWMMCDVEHSKYRAKYPKMQLTNEPHVATTKPEQEWQGN
jgi:hypothetical protein